MAYAELSSAGVRIDVNTRYEEKELIKSIPGSRYDGNAKQWSVPLTWVACLQLRGVFDQDLHVGPRLTAWSLQEYNDRVRPIMEIRGLLEPQSLLDSVNEGLYKFQAAGADFMVATQQGLLGDEMGTGKTIQQLETLVRVQDSLPALVICPNSTKFNWEKEAKIWGAKANPYVITGGAVGRKKVLKAASEDPNALVIINIEAVRSHSRLASYGSVHLTKCVECAKDFKDDVNLTPTLVNQRAALCEVHPRELNKIPFKTVIVDEAHRMKDPRSKQTRAIWACGQNPHVTRRYALTGTPIANDPSDLWAIFHFLAPDEHPTKTKFVDRYCLQSFNAYGGLSVVGIAPQMRNEFQRVIGPRFRRITKAEVLDQLPPKQRQIVKVELTVKQRKAYNDIETSLATRVNGGIIVAASNLTAQIRLLQLAAAECEVTPTGEVRLTDKSPKVDALMDLLDAARGKPIVVAAEHRQLIEVAARRLDKEKMPYGLITGAISEWDRKRNLQRFQDGELPVLMFTIKAGGTGLTMTRADTIIFIQRSWSMIDNKQAEDRVHRIGSEIHEAINIIDIVADGTVEDDVLERYAEKLHRLDQVTEDRKRLKAQGIDTSDLDELEALIMKSHLGDL